MEYVWAAAQAQPELTRMLELRDGHRISGAIKAVATAIAALEQHKTLHPAEAALVLANGNALLVTARAAEVRRRCMSHVCAANTDERSGGV
jgi:hypothetical protein